MKIIDNLAKLEREPNIGAAILLLAAAVATLLGCAHQPPVAQIVEIRVEPDDPKLTGPLDCEAANSAGSWRFSAPGSVAVLPSTSPLKITCTTPPGVLAEPNVTTPGSLPARDRAREGASTGTKIGAGAGVALGVAAAPVMGPAFAVVIVAGSALKGGEIGGVVAAVNPGEKVHYPSPIVLRVKAAAPNN